MQKFFRHVTEPSLPHRTFIDLKQENSGTSRKIYKRSQRRNGNQNCLEKTVQHMRNAYVYYDCVLFSKELFVFLKMLGYHGIILCTRLLVINKLNIFRPKKIGETLTKYFACLCFISLSYTFKCKFNPCSSCLSFCLSPLSPFLWFLPMSLLLSLSLSLSLSLNISLFTHKYEFETTLPHVP